MNISTVNSFSRQPSFCANRHILMVEDDPLVRTTLARSLSVAVRRLSNGEDKAMLTECDNLQDAQNALVGKKFDAVITDGKFPDSPGTDPEKNGIAVMKKALDEGHKPDQIVILSGEDSLKPEAEKAGVLFLEKPAMLQQLTDFLRKAFLAADNP